MIGRRLLAALACVCALAVPQRARAGTPPIIVFVGPSDPIPEVAITRQALEGLARRHGTVLIDLTPRSPAAPHAGSHLRRGIDAYLAFKYDDALRDLDAGLAEAVTTGARGLRPSELSDLLLYRALVSTQRGDSTRAWDDYLRAAAVDPTRRLDPVRFPPRASETFTRAVAAVARGVQTSTSVAVPSACAVWIDARAAKPNTPMDLAPGEHYVRVACPGKQLYGTRVVVRGATHTVRPALGNKARPGPAEAAREARRRGADSLLLALVVRARRGPTTIGIRLLDATTLRERGRVVSRIDRQRGTARIIASAQRLIDAVITPVAPVVVVGKRPWYRRSWVWGVAGAAVATAVLLPFVFEPDRPSGFPLTLGGVLP